MAFMSVRRQKRSSASLFDLRKQGVNGKRPLRGSESQDIEIEFSNVTSRKGDPSNEEVVPLVDTSSNPLAVI